MPEKKYNDSRSNIPAELSRAVKVESGHACAIKNCGEHTYLEIHHINQNRDDNKLENLILLCDKHHKMAHQNVIDRKSLHEYKKLLSNSKVDELSSRLFELENLLKTAGLKGVLPKPINLILEEGVLQGNRLWGTVEGNAVARQIYDLVRERGTEMDKESIELMVKREDSYSRVGLNGLSILYDEHFTYANSLELVSYFESLELEAVAFYCALRENYPGEQGLSACMKSRNFRYKNMFIGCDLDYLFSKYPNRGSSVVLDCLGYENVSSPNK